MKDRMWQNKQCCFERLVLLCVGGEEPGKGLAVSDEYKKLQE